MYDLPMIGLFPFEAETDSHSTLVKLFKSQDGHVGNTITEILKVEDLFNSSFQPKTWQDFGSKGIDWSLAVQELGKAISHVIKRSFARNEKEIVDENKSSAAQYSPRFI